MRDQLSLFLEHPESSKLAAAFQSTIMVLIFMSTTAIVLQTVPDIAEGYSSELDTIEITAIFVFSVELALRFAACESLLVFCRNGFNLIDFVAILPGFAMAFGQCSAARCKASNAIISLRILRLMWLMRLLRLAKVVRHSRLLSVFVVVVRQIWHSSILLVAGLMLVLIVTSSSLLHLVEYDRCEALGLSCDGFESITSSAWFAVSTLTTVGYGDVIPQTVLGKIIAGGISICAVMMLALGGALFSYDFAEHFREERQRSMVELQLKVEGEVNEETQEEVMELVKELRTACDRLVQGLGEAAQRRKDWDRLGNHVATSSAGPVVHRSSSMYPHPSTSGHFPDATADDGATGSPRGESPLHARSQPSFLQRRSPGPSPLIMMPMLRLIEEQCRAFSHEAQACVLAGAINSKDSEDLPPDIRSYISYEEEDVTTHQASARLLQVGAMPSS